MLNYLTVPVTPFQQNCSIVWCDVTRQAAVIDPGGDLNVILKDAIAAARSGGNLRAAEATAIEALWKAGFAHVDYVAIRDAETLDHITTLQRPARILAAAKIGKTRLIDNMAIA